MIIIRFGRLLLVTALALFAFRHWMAAGSLLAGSIPELQYLLSSAIIDTLMWTAFLIMAVLAPKDKT